MSDHRVWSLNLGRWGHVQVRLHMFFLLFAAFTLYLSLRYSSTDARLSWLGVLSIVILLISVIIHELGHYLIAVRLGGGADQIILGPLGGLSPVRVPYEPRCELIAVLAGPLVNLVICLLCLAALLFIGQGQSELGPTTITAFLNPLAPLVAVTDHPPKTGLICLQLAFWINWVLFLVNMIPAFPFDGGRVLLALFALSPRPLGARRCVLIVASIAKVVAVGLLIAAWLVRKDRPNPVVPTWFALVLLSIFLFFSARMEESQQETEGSDDEMFGDFSQGYTSLERPEERGGSLRGPFMGWIERRREQRRRRLRTLEAEDDRRMDDILARLHETGMKNLSPQERALLNRVSARYRSREEK